MLEELQEPPLRSAGREGEAIYRFLWVGCWPGDFMFVGVTSSREGRILWSSREGAGRPVRRTLSDKEWEEFSVYLKKSSWDSMSVSNGIIGLDGGHWVIEGIREGRYHYVERWSPDPGPFLDLCLFMTDLSGTSFDPY